MTWPIVDLTFWNPGDGRSDAIDRLLADPATPLARHGLTGLASAYARETGAELHDVHRRWADQLTTRSLGVDGALSDVAALFEHSELLFFVAKGPAIAYTSYVDPGLRPYCDLDIYVAEADEKRARSALRAAGYSPVQHAFGALGGLAQEEHGGRFGATVELHCHVVDNLHRRHLPPVDAFFPFVERRVIAGIEAPVLNPPAHLALQAMHAAASHRYSKLVLLRDLDTWIRLHGPSTPSSIAADAYLAAATRLLATLGRQTAHIPRSGTAPGHVARSLTRRDPARWDEYSLSLANLVAFLHQPSWATSARVAIGASSTAFGSSRGRRAPLGLYWSKAR